MDYTVVTSPTKPSRSEEPTSAEESAAFKAQAQEFFESQAPKRAPKPSRSEIAEGEVTDAAAPSGGVNDTERRHLDELNQSHESLIPPTSPESPEEYQSTEYYGTVSFDQKHCPTGEGFIQLDMKQRCPVNVSAVYHQDAHPFAVTGSLTNPARDDWKKAVEPAAVL